MGEIAGRLERALDRLDAGACARCSVPWGKRLAAGFALGLARGLGMAVGFTVLGAAIVALLQRLLALGAPVIGDYLADVIRIVLERL